MGRLNHHGISISMDGRGRAIDNVFVERLQQDQFVVSEGQVTKNLISLYKALGGGWWTAVASATRP